MISLALFASALFMLSSCSTYLTPAILGNNMGYLPKAMVADSLIVLTSVSGSFAGAASPVLGSVAFEMGMLSINRSHTFKKFNISYGVFGYLGKAELVRDDNFTSGSSDYLQSFKKNINGLGLRTSAGFHTTSTNGNTDFRFINWENAISNESGEYADLRSAIYDNNIYKYTNVTNKNIIWTTGLSSEIIWRARRNHDIKHAFRLFVGGNPGLASSFKYDKDVDSHTIGASSIGWTFNYFLSVKKFTLSIETANNVNYAQKISVGYAF